VSFAIAHIEELWDRADLSRRHAKAYDSLARLCLKYDLKPLPSTLAGEPPRFEGWPEDWEGRTDFYTLFDDGNRPVGLIRVSLVGDFIGGIVGAGIVNRLSEVGLELRLQKGQKCNYGQDPESGGATGHNPPTPSLIESLRQEAMMTEAMASAALAGGALDMEE
jgi:hypothetical protein